MGDPAWKKFERLAASLFGGKRFWANSGERMDFEGPKHVGQCKLVKHLSLEQLTALAEEASAVGAERGGKAGVVCVKVRRGSGEESAALVVMTFEDFKRLYEAK